MEIALWYTFWICAWFGWPFFCWGWTKARDIVSLCEREKKKPRQTIRQLIFGVTKKRKFEPEHRVDWVHTYYFEFRICNVCKILCCKVCWKCLLIPITSKLYILVKYRLFFFFFFQFKVLFKVDSYSIHITQALMSF